MMPRGAMDGPARLAMEADQPSEGSRARRRRPKRMTFPTEYRAVAKRAARSAPRLRPTSSAGHGSGRPESRVEGQESRAGAQEVARPDSERWPERRVEPSARRALPPHGAEQVNRRGAASEYGRRAWTPVKQSMRQDAEFLIVNGGVRHREPKRPSLTANRHPGYKAAAERRERCGAPGS